MFVLPYTVGRSVFRAHLHNIIYYINRDRFDRIVFTFYGPRARGPLSATTVLLILRAEYYPAVVPLKCRTLFVSPDSRDFKFKTRPYLRLTHSRLRSEQNLNFPVYRESQ